MTHTQYDSIERVGEEFGQYLTGQFFPLRTYVVEVDSIDTDSNLAYVKLFDDGEALPVPMTIQGLDSRLLNVQPRVGSNVVMAFLNGDENSPFFVKYTEVDKIEVRHGSTTIDVALDPDDSTNDEIEVRLGESSVKMTESLIEFNDGALDGLVSIHALTDKLNQLVSEFNAFVSTFNGHTHLVPPGTFLIGATAGVPNTGTESTNSPVQSGSDATDFDSSDYINEKITQ